MNLYDLDQYQYRTIFNYTQLAKNLVISLITSAAMKAEERKDEAPCQGTPAGETA